MEDLSLVLHAWENGLFFPKFMTIVYAVTPFILYGVISFIERD